MDFSEAGILFRMAALHDAAKRIAKTAPESERWNTYQDTWVAYLRWPPRTYGLAITMAKNARNQIWRYGKRHPTGQLDRHIEESRDEHGDKVPRATPKYIVHRSVPIPPPTDLRFKEDDKDGDN